MTGRRAYMLFVSKFGVSQKSLSSRRNLFDKKKKTVKAVILKYLYNLKKKFYVIIIIIVFLSILKSVLIFVETKILFFIVFQ